MVKRVGEERRVSSGKERRTPLVVKRGSEERGISLVVNRVSEERRISPMVKRGLERRISLTGKRGGSL